MFLKYKTNHHYFLSNKTKKFLLAVLILFVAILVINSFKSKNKVNDQMNVNNQMNLNEEVTENTSENITDGEVIKNVTYGSDIKKKYKEVKGTDFAILITTMDFLKEAEAGEKEEHLRYILEDADSNVISVIKDADGNAVSAVFVNYNRLLKDTVVMKDISGGYIAPYGFSDESNNQFNAYNEGNSIKIDNKAIFSEYPVFNEDYEEIGILYIERINQ